MEHRLKPLTLVETLLKIDGIPQGNRPASSCLLTAGSPRPSAKSQETLYLPPRACRRSRAHIHTQTHKQTKKACCVLGENGRVIRVEESGCTCADEAQPRYSGGSKCHCWRVSCRKTQLERVEESEGERERERHAVQNLNVAKRNW